MTPRAMAHIQPFLMFQGQAEQAINFYLSLFAESELKEIVRYGPGQPGPEGSVMRAAFRLGSQELLCIDSPIQHAFTFTPAFSLFVECTSEEELRRLAAALSDGGSILMPLENYGFSLLFTWVNDRFGVSWQLNLK
jgi:predicted 3-demethylubiquinone-9 3-methyltransferase (glyoxalase superfamily)